jgi:hypothetical protein
MIELNIALLNLNSPYYVVQDADGDLLFETDYGVKYGISFELNEGMMNYPAYEFGILNKNGQPSPNDRKLRDTILAIIVEKTHPDLKLILARFDELAAFLKKPIT